jgi:hypothetical protein
MLVRDAFAVSCDDPTRDAISLWPRESALRHTVASHTGVGGSIRSPTIWK